MKSSFGWDDFVRNSNHHRFHPRVFRKAFVPMLLLTDGKKLGKEGDTFDALCTDCGIKECHWADHSDPENYPDDLITYKTNAYGFRSDEFDKSLTPQNYLFGGCSFTFGTGLPYDQTWAYMLNEHLGKEKFFNCGVSGSGYEVILSNAYNYIEKYGNPEAVFLLMPNVQRDIFFTSHTQGLTAHHNHWADHKNYPQVESPAYSYDVLFFKFYRQMLHFEYYCEAKNIPLLWTTWDIDVAFGANGCQFNSYILHQRDFKKQSKIKVPKEKGKYWSIGRDQHPGADFALQVAQTFEIEWRKRNEKTA